MQPPEIGASADSGGVGDSRLTQTKRYYGTGTNDFVKTNFHRTYRGHNRGIDRKNGTAAFAPIRTREPKGPAACN